MSAWGTFWRSVRRNLRSLGRALASPSARQIAEEANAGWRRALNLADRATALAAQLEADLAEAVDALAEMRRDRNLARSLVAASPEEAKRVCLDLSDRNAELRRDLNDLEKRFAELQRERAS